MPDRHGPFRSNRFTVELPGIAIGGFSRVHLPAATTTTVSYREGNHKPPGTTKLAGLQENETLVLERGVTASTELYEWYKTVEDGKLAEARGAIAVTLLDEEQNPGPRWEFRNAWPVRYQPPVLDASENAVAVETIEIAHEGMERVGPD